jgi:hypothetical protein
MSPFNLKEVHSILSSPESALPPNKKDCLQLCFSKLDCLVPTSVVMTVNTRFEDFTGTTMPAAFDLYLRVLW